MATDPEDRWTCVDHGIADCEDCGQWHDAATVRDAEYERIIAALTAERDEARRRWCAAEEALNAAESAYSRMVAERDEAWRQVSTLLEAIAAAEVEATAAMKRGDCRGHCDMPGGCPDECRRAVVRRMAIPATTALYATAAGIRKATGYTGGRDDG